MPPCPAIGYKHECFGTTTYYVGEFRDNKRHGQGTYIFPDGSKYVGEFRDHKLNGQGIRYRADGSVIRSGLWTDGDLTQSYTLDTNRFPFNPSTQATASPSVDTGKAERDRLAAELQAERSRRQALEDRLASEVREKQRLASVERSRSEQTGDGTPDDQTCRRYGFTVATSPYANCRQQLDMARRQQEQYEQQVAAAEEEARRRRMREFGMRLLQGQQIGEAAMAASGMALPERPRPTSIISPQGPIVCQYYSAMRSFVCQ